MKTVELKKSLIALTIVLVMISCVGRENATQEQSTTIETKVENKTFVSEEIKPLVKYIEQCNTSPIDYIMNLFEKFDVVVLGERDHRDISQYELFNQIISDPRFAATVGHVFTEVGCYNMADELNTVLKGTYPNDAIFDKELVNVIFNMDFIPVWEKTNYTKLMKDVYLINKNLSDKDKISVTPTEMPFSWKQTQSMTGEEFKKTVHKMWEHKDLIMGNNAINELYKIFNGKDLRKKVLIIYNTPHSCLYFENKHPFFAYQIIADRFPGRVANVMLNWSAGYDNEDNITLSNNGKIDAAFAACNNKSIGFDLVSSPFGDCFFDVIGSAVHGEKMKDVYHGFIFYKPVLEWVLSIGVPNLDKLDCKDELMRRRNIFNNTTKDENKNALLRYYSTVRSFPPTENIKHIYEQIGRYYEE